MTPNLDQERVERAAESAMLCLRGIDDGARVSELTRGEVETVCRAAIADYLGDTDTSCWQDIATCESDLNVLVCNPDEGTSPVLAIKIEGVFYPSDMRDGPDPLSPQPKFWLRWPSIGRLISATPTVNGKGK